MRPEMKPHMEKIRQLAAEMGVDISDNRKPKTKDIMAHECQECAKLREANSRLTDEISGLYERISEGDKRQEKHLADMEQSRDEWMQSYFDLQESISAQVDEQDADDLDRYRNWVISDKENLGRLRLLEAENAMLRRARGSGVGRGRMPNWTPYQAGQVRELQAGGQSLREISRAVGVTVSQVRTILSRPPERPHPETERAEKLVRRTQELDALIRGAQVAVAKENRRAIALQKAAATKRSKRR